MPVLFLLTDSVTDPSHLCYAFTRPLNGFLITLALRPCCSWVFSRFSNRWLLVPVMLPVSLLLSYVELMGVDRLVLAFGLPSLESQSWVAIFYIRAAMFMIWMLLYFGIKSIKLHAAIEREFRALGVPFVVRQINQADLAWVYGAAAVLVRPDLHVAWRGRPDEVDPRSLARRVTGAPTA